jgi:hypothetical protein
MLVEYLVSKQSDTPNSSGHVELEDIVPLFGCQVGPFLGRPVRSLLKAALQRFSLKKRVRDVKLFEAGICQTLRGNGGLDKMTYYWSIACIAM